MRKSPIRAAGRTLLAVVLVAVAVILAAALWRLSAAASAGCEDPSLRGYLIRMTYLTAVLLMLTLAIMAMRGIRWVVARFKPPPPTEPTSQVSAWVEAGKRFELPEVEQPEGDEDPSEP